MPYRGDYYHRGDYRRGDPGLFGFLGGIAKKALGFIPGVGPALSVGAAVVPALLHKREQQIASGQLQPNFIGRHILPHLTSTAPIGSGVAGTAHGRIQRQLTAGAGTAMVPSDGVPRGYHLIRHGPNAGGVAKNRRMNWANPHALGRAERRIHSAVKHFARYIRWVHPKREGHAAPKFKGHKTGRKK